LKPISKEDLLAWEDQAKRNMRFAHIMGESSDAEARILDLIEVVKNTSEDLRQKLKDAEQILNCIAYLDADKWLDRSSRKTAESYFLKYSDGGQAKS